MFGRGPSRKLIEQMFDDCKMYGKSIDMLKFCLDVGGPG